MKNAFAESSFVLRSEDEDAEPPALVGVEASGRIEGVMFTLELRQSYLNAGPEPLEVVYSFPLPSGAVLLGLAAEFEGRRLVGTVLARQQAEDRYERALAEGDTPVLLEVSGLGVHTASIGNLAPGVTCTLEVRFAQLLRFESGRLRVAIPTTVAPRYGDAERAGLQPHHMPGVSLAAEYPFALALTIAGPLGRGRIECPTHAHRLEPDSDGVRLVLEAGAALDRDVVVVFTPEEPLPGLLLLAADAASREAPTVALAAFAVPPGPPRPAISLRLLVDCSGSMEGDSIDSARAALRAVVESLAPDDEASLTRFGSHIEHVLGVGLCGARHLERLRRGIDATDADMGGTEMRAALQSVFRAWAPRNEAVDVLLVTDGEIWQSAELVAEARRSRHRVFAIGVGSSPAEHVLRELAEATGGACEFATPGESMRQAAARMLERMRQPVLLALHVDWGKEAVWQADPPAQTFGGDTVLAFAAFGPGAAPEGRVRLLARAKSGAQGPVALTTGAEAAHGTDLARVVAARRFAAAMAVKAKSEALKIALDHQLVTALTHCVLVHERADEDRVTREARLQRVPGMLAAGWGGTGSVQFSLAAASPVYETFQTPSVWRRASRSDPLASIVGSLDMEEIELPAFLRKTAESAMPPTLREVMRRVADHLCGGGDLGSLALEAAGWELAAALRTAIDEVEALGIERARVWLLLALWAARRKGRNGDAATGQRLDAFLDRVDAADEQRAAAVFDRVLGSIASDSWQTSRARRLARAFAGLVRERQS